MSKMAKGFKQLDPHTRGTVENTMLQWAQMYGNTVDEMTHREGTNLNPDTAKEVAALILVQAMEAVNEV